VLNLGLGLMETKPGALASAKGCTSSSPGAQTRARGKRQWPKCRRVVCEGNENFLCASRAPVTWPQSSGRPPKGADSTLRTLGTSRMTKGEAVADRPPGFANDHIPRPGQRARSMVESSRSGDPGAPQERTTTFSAVLPRGCAAAVRPWCEDSHELQAVGGMHPGNLGWPEARSPL